MPSALLLSTEAVLPAVVTPVAPISIIGAGAGAGVIIIGAISGVAIIEDISGVAAGLTGSIGRGIVDLEACQRAQKPR